MSFEKSAIRSIIWAIIGTALAMAANTTFGDPANLALAGFVGGIIGSCLGWIVLQEQARFQHEEARSLVNEHRWLRQRSFR